MEMPSVDRFAAEDWRSVRRGECAIARATQRVDCILRIGFGEEKMTILR